MIGQEVREPTESAVPIAPGRLPALGHVAALARRPMDFLESLRAHGELVRVDLAHQRLVVVTRPELVRQLLVEQADRCERGLIYDRARAVFGNGLVTSDGDFHRRQRRLMQPAFGIRRTTDYARIMSRHAGALAGSWRAGQSVEIVEVMDRLALDIAVDALFTHELTRPAAERIRRPVPVIVDGLLPRMLVPAALDRLPIPVLRRFDSAAADLRAALDEIIAAYRGDPGGQTDLLSILLAADMSDAEVRDEVVSLLMAGTETLASALIWMFHELAAHTEVRRRLHAEVDTVLGPRPAESADLPRLEYTRMIVEEVLRLHPALLFVRRAVRTVELAGVRLPPGTEIAYSSHALHRDPILFERPTEFDPDRWLPHRVVDFPKGAFSPFGLGRHRCIGESYARAELAIVTATIAARWRLDPESGRRLRIRPSVVPRPRALRMVAVPRT